MCSSATISRVPSPMLITCARPYAGRMSLYQIVNPATGVTEAGFPTTSDEELAIAVADADAAYRQWRLVDLERRVAVLLRVAELHEQRARELAGLITREMGKPIRSALAEIQISADIYRYYATEGPGFLRDEELAVASGGTAVVRRAPIGVLLGIMPWNYPFYQVARFAAPNLLLGNTILLKHAPSTPASAAAIAQIITTALSEAGLPAGAYRNIYASNEQVAHLIADPRVQGVSLTGSERAGSAVAEVAGRHLKKVVLELGGSDPFLVLDTDDLERVVSAAAAARLGNAGQACNAAKRFIVVDGLYERFVELLRARFEAIQPGDPSDPATRFGPLSSEAAVQNLLALVADAREHGAEVVLGGERYERPGAWLAPTIVTGVTPAARLYREEAFGPVAQVYRVADVDEAVELANDSSYGLGAAVFTQDEQLAQEVADRLDVGMVFINAPTNTAPDLPFGGVKRSGIGRELGRYGIDEFANRKLVRTPAPRG